MFISSCVIFHKGYIVKLKVKFNSMKNNLFFKIALIVVSILLFSCNNHKNYDILFVCSEDNDLFVAANDFEEIYQRFY